MDSFDELPCRYVTMQFVRFTVSSQILDLPRVCIEPMLTFYIVSEQGKKVNHVSSELRLASVSLQNNTLVESIGILDME